MLVIGLTGPSGAGKSAAASAFAASGIPVIDADAVYHALLVPPSPCVEALRHRFGDAICRNDGTLDRPALSAIVFSDEAALADLNAISHRFVIEKIRERLAALRDAGTAVVVLDAPQLFESGVDADCDTVVAVLAKYETRLLRIMERDGIDHERAKMRLRAQHDEAFFRAHADHIIENDTTTEELTRRIHALLKDLGVRND